ncbi:MAG: alpha-L-rhamnosidase N-terminal domain-containing protein, partial [Mariniphaga sp.]
MKIKLIALFLLALAAACTSQKRISPIEVTTLRCEYLPNPVGMDVLNPRLSWQMKKDLPGASQTAYRILVATSAEELSKNSGDLWDTGKIDSDQSTQVAYAGKPMKSGEKVFWKVQIWDETKSESTWSTVSEWEMGLLNATDWQAKWIGAPASLTTGDLKHAAPLFRKELNLLKKVKKASVYISGLGYYELYINGTKIGDHVLSPNQTNYDRQKVEKWEESRIGNMTSTVLYETFDITASLKEGGNALGVILGNGWYLQADRPNDTMLWYDTPRLMAQFKIEY